jgi:hypothetical protein
MSDFLERFLLPAERKLVSGNEKEIRRGTVVPPTVTKKETKKTKSLKSVNIKFRSVENDRLKRKEVGGRDRRWVAGRARFAGRGGGGRRGKSTYLSPFSS